MDTSVISYLLQPDAPEKMEEIYDRLDAMNIQIVSADLDLDLGDELDVLDDDLGDDVDLKQVARTTAGFVGADLENLMNEAALLAVRREEKILLLQECGHQAVENLKAGLYD